MKPVPRPASRLMSALPALLLLSARAPASVVAASTAPSAIKVLETSQVLNYDIGGVGSLTLTALLYLEKLPENPASKGDAAAKAPIEVAVRDVFNLCFDGVVRWRFGDPKGKPLGLRSQPSSSSSSSSSGNTASFVDAKVCGQDLTDHTNCLVGDLSTPNATIAGCATINRDLAIFEALSETNFDAKIGVWAVQRPNEQEVFHPLYQMTKQRDLPTFVDQASLSP
ncbi:uncharacterized protein PFL1_04684 [Pseudozyma flocculosa PF-1]|uniref:Uncharacterized protein n=2 Tax=Pseudozyma flocculosa TaxID=84751 RepID=A0A5C3FC56_9BASI|nr:uncharacterized protein PFL1_04684 [Pseudozyma flocculosa PF-1]EPQ27940.1 hypothetical protein PFL1_04684 [Pseudozyma flocculosa PF-1]SPO41726.1 uncharacterized protein PSFLO_07208 [Pseudozyma flocculosa]